MLAKTLLALRMLFRSALSTHRRMLPVAYVNWLCVDLLGGHFVAHPGFQLSSVEQWLASNQTQAQIQQNLENVCAALPGGMSSLVRFPSQRLSKFHFLASDEFLLKCDQFVEQYLPVAIQWILNNEPPQTFCTQLGLCSSEKKSAIVMLPKPAKPLPVPKDGSLCGICELTIASVEQWLQQNTSVAEVEQYLQNVCSLLPSSIGQLVRLALSFPSFLANSM